MNVITVHSYLPVLNISFTTLLNKYFVINHKMIRLIKYEIKF